MSERSGSLNFEGQLPDEDLLRQLIKQSENVLNIESSEEMECKQSDEDASIKMLCERHKAPAAFFSQKENRYVCFKCLVS